MTGELGPGLAPARFVVPAERDGLALGGAGAWPVRPADGAGLGPEAEREGDGMGPEAEREGDGMGPGTAVRAGVAVALGAGLTGWIAGRAGVGSLVAPAPVSIPPATTPPTMTAVVTTAADQFLKIRLRRRRSPSRMISGAAFGCAAAAA